MQMTKAQLDATILEQIKNAFGSEATLDDVVRTVKEFAEFKARQDLVADQNIQNLTRERDGEDHPYRKSAKHLFENDHAMIQGRAHNRKGMGLMMARILRVQAAAALMRSQGKVISDEDFALNVWGEKWLAEEVEKAKDPENVKALTGGLTPASTGGGAVVPVEHMREIIELLRSANIVRASGARVIPLPAGNLTMPRLTASATSTYTAENTAVNASNESLDQVSLSAKKLISVVAVSNDLLVSSDPAVDQIVRDDLVRTLANREDLAFIREPAGANNPTGIRNITGVQTQAQSGATVTAIASDYSSQIELVEGTDAPMRNPVFWMTSRTKNQLLGKVTTDEQFAFRDELNQGRFMGWPFMISNQIPNNLGAGTNESEVYFGDASEIIIGDTRVMEMTVHPGGAYNDSGGTLRSGISNDMTVFKIVSSHDLDLLHATSFSYTSAVNL